MTNPSDHILWIDLETTGLSFTHDDILEVGMILTDRDLRQVAVYQHVCRPRSLTLAESRMKNTPDSIVWQMHQDNGLWEAATSETSPPVWVMDANVESWLMEKVSTFPIPIAGSGVAAFDRHMIRSQMHRLNKLLTYWSYDVGAMRRFYEDICGLGGVSYDQENKTHRALDDVAFHLSEAIAFKDMFRDMASAHVRELAHG